MDMYALAFVMKWVGYRFQETSLVRALSYDDRVEWPSCATCEVPLDDPIRRSLRESQLAPDDQSLAILTNRCRKMVAAGLDERERRRSA